MFGKISSRLLVVSLLAVVAGCNKTDTGGAIDAGGSAAAPTPAVVQGACPQVYLLEGTAVHRSYAKGAKDDPTQIIYQASLADTTRQCVQNETQLIMTIVVQGRVVAGPAGGAGTVNLPIRIAATDSQNTLYSELTQYPVDVPASGAAQFIFTKTDVVIPGGAGTFAKVYVGFDEGPVKGKKTK
ncbi:hypothetical protein [Pararhizobium gei]|uniref:hypothetical protein n=1 Tax=Pararhizobium gei TaxID=1395951 RepID=UPI0023DB756B|nr:hypothetical protein [Rhizobium gei]